MWCRQKPPREAGRLALLGLTWISFGRAAVVAGVVPVSHTIHVRCRPDYEGRKRLAGTVPPAQARSSNAQRNREPAREAHLPKGTATFRRHHERRVPTR